MANLTTANPEMAAAWNGEEGARWVADADRYERSGTQQWETFLEAGLVGPTDAVLDLGCGAGGSTCDVARLTTGEVLGVDLSERLLDKARQCATRLPHVRFLQADVQVHPFAPESFDLAISRYGVMFFSDRAAAFRNVAHALRPGGRLALLVWQGLDRNPWLAGIRDALAMGRDLPVPPPHAPSPFALAEPDHVRELLASCGFVDVQLTPVAGVAHFGDDADDAFSWAQRMGPVLGLLQDLDDADREAGLRKLYDLFQTHATPAGVQLDSSSWLITGRRSSLPDIVGGGAEKSQSGGQED